jgi:hypothetical protein
MNSDSENAALHSLPLRPTLRVSGEIARGFEAVCGRLAGAPQSKNGMWWWRRESNPRPAPYLGEPFRGRLIRPLLYLAELRHPHGCGGTVRYSEVACASRAHERTIWRNRRLVQRISASVQAKRSALRGGRLASLRIHSLASILDECEVMNLF